MLYQTVSIWYYHGSLTVKNDRKLQFWHVSLDATKPTKITSSQDTSALSIVDAILPAYTVSTLFWSYLNVTCLLQAKRDRVFFQLNVGINIWPWTRWILKRLQILVISYQIYSYIVIWQTYLVQMVSWGGKYQQWPVGTLDTGPSLMPGFSTMWLSTFSG